MTLELIHSLLTSSRKDQQWFYARQIPLSVFSTDEAAITWVYKYREQRGVYPALSAFKQRFPNLDLPQSEPDSLISLAESALDSDVFSQITLMVDRARDMHEGGRPIREVVSYLQHAASAVRTYESSFQDSTLDAKATLREYKEYVRQRLEKSIDPSPWPSFNQLVGRIMPGEQIVISARTSIGKTWLALEWAHYFATALGLRVLFVSKELPTPQVRVRWMARKLHISHPDLRRGNLRPRQLGKLARYARLPPKEAVLISGLDEVKGGGFGPILQKVNQFKPDVLVVDGAYLIYPEEKTSNNVERFSLVSSTLKRLAMAHRMITVPIVQANRTGEAESDSGSTRSSLANIYGGDAWAQDADYLVMLNGRRGAPARMVELQKAREAELGKWKIHFQLHPYPKFSEVSDGSSDTGSVTFTGI